MSVIDDAPWSTLLTVCQEEIAQVGSHPYYRSTYRHAETFYWSHIPYWLYLDAPMINPRRCLDIGCAYGTLLLYTLKLTGCEAYGLDFIDAYLSRELIEKYSLHFGLSNIELDPVPWGGLFDIILLTETLEHFNFAPVATLRKIRRLLGDRGRLYLSTPDATAWGRTRRYYASFRDMPCADERGRSGVVDDHVWQFSEDELREILDAAGFHVERFDFAPGVAGLRHFNLTLGTS